MKATFYNALVLLPLLSLVGCVSPTRVDYDSASVERIRSYKCYTIDTRETRAHYQDVTLSPIVDRRIERSIETVMQQRGFANERSRVDAQLAYVRVHTFYAILKISGQVAKWWWARGN